MTDANQSPKPRRQYRRSGVPSEAYLRRLAGLPKLTKHQEWLQECQYEKDLNRKRHLALLALNNNLVTVIENPPEVTYNTDDNEEHYIQFDCITIDDKGYRTAILYMLSLETSLTGSDLEAVKKYNKKTCEIAIDEFKIMTEDDLTLDDIVNADHILMMRRKGEDKRPDAKLRKLIPKLSEPTSIGSLVSQLDAAGFQGIGFRAIVRLIDSKELIVISGSQIDYDMVVFRP